MIERPYPEELIASSQEALRRSDGAAADRSAGDDPGPGLGDIVRLPRLGSHDAEWIVLLLDPADDRRILVVPCDGFTLIGGGDVAVGSSANGSLRVARCRYGGWIDSAEIADLPVLDRLREKDLDRVRERWFDLARERGTGTVRERDVEETVDYQELVRDQLAPLQRSLFGLHVDAVEVSSPPERIARDEPASVQERLPSNRGPALAASVLLIAVAAFAGVQWLSWERGASQLRGKTFATNPAYVTVSAAARTRSAPPSLRAELTAKNSHLLLHFPVGERDPAARYRLTIFPPDSQEPLWTGEDLVPTAWEDLVVGLPRNVFPESGVYGLRLERWLDDALELHTTTRMDITLSAD